jgi:NitT/TauT family transport system permease protein
MAYVVTPIKDSQRAVFTKGDFVVLLLVAFFLIGIVMTAERWHETLTPDLPIHLTASALPKYALYSLFRALIAYGFSLGFTLVIGYWAAKRRAAEQIILPLLDIGQSIPVLGFLPGLVLGLIALFPQSNFGLELACIIMIFTGQVWNMTFSFYSSLKSVPQHFFELSQNVALNWRQRLWTIELPYSASGLAWNSLMSMAGGWFFLTVCEAFTLGDRHFRLPGLGSYMAVAIDKGDMRAMMMGVATMVVVIVAMDFFIWRPLVAWTSRFRLDEQEDEAREIPFMELLLKESKVVKIFQSVLRWVAQSRPQELVVVSTNARKRRSMFNFQFLQRVLQRGRNKRWVQMFWAVVFITAVVVVSGRLYALVESLSVWDYWTILKNTGATFTRVVVVLVVASVWTVPFGIWVGLSPRLTRFFQPIIQVAASFPAPMLYPIVLFVLSRLGIGLGIGAAVLMMIGVQWYILFNVLAGATNISKELRDTFDLTGVSKRETWINLYLPSVFPNLVTGWVTAAGGAWNASIVAEYIHYQGETLTTTGLGALISAATATGNYAMLTASLVVMVGVVVVLNRLVWHPTYAFVERRYRFER